MTDGSYLFSSEAAASAPLTLADLQRTMALMEEQRHRAMEEQARRASAWADLHLDLSEATEEEKFWIAYAQSMDAIHPRDAERVEQIVAKYRRDGRDGGGAVDG